MRSSLRTQLFINGLVILVIGMGLAGILFWRAAGNLYLETQRENLQAQAELTAAALRGQPLPDLPNEPYMQTSNVMPGLHSRLLSNQGAVVIGLPVIDESVFIGMPEAEGYNAVTPEELLTRPEIISASQGSAATEVREVLADHRRVLYAAAPVFSDNGVISGFVYLAMPLPAGGLPTAFLYQLGLAALSAVILALVAGTLLSRRVTAPVAAIIQSARAVSSGDLEQHVPEKSGISELDSLGQAFNHMVASLKRADQTQNAFVADVAHELRTPLTVIKGTVETLEDGAMDDLEGRGPLLTSMQRETDRLIRLVNNLLILTRADAGMLKLDIKPLDLSELCRQRRDQFAGMAEKQNIRLVVNNGKPCPVSGDVDRLTQVLDNLLNNALRYSPNGSVIRIDITTREKMCRCAIRDAGPGIPAEHLPRIFDRFYRVESSRSKRGGEAGLGLAIVRALIEAHGGEVFVESQTGEGTTVGFSLPIAPDLTVN